ncbi:MAG: AraC family transcriptional regulator [Proteobacteria bacterium]|nr:AraC family transcriptional regulator [Pseudomonadota bacterium]
MFSPPRLKFCAGWIHELATTYCSFHSHPRFEIVYHHRGDGVTTIQGRLSKRSMPYTEGSACIYPPNLMHDQRNPERATDVCIQFSLPKPYPSILCHYWSLPPPLSDYEREEIWNLAQLHSSLSIEESYLYGYRLAALLIHLLIISSRHTASKTKSVEARYAEEARNYIRMNYKEIQQMEQVAGAVGIGYDYLRHVFKATYGISLVHCLNKFRMEKAQSLLIHSRLPLKTIASLCGFNNERYFLTSFKRAIHSTPGAFRKSKTMKRYR